MHTLTPSMSVILPVTALPSRRWKRLDIPTCRACAALASAGDTNPRLSAAGEMAPTRGGPATSDTMIVMVGIIVIIVVVYEAIAFMTQPSSLSVLTSFETLARVSPKPSSFRPATACLDLSPRGGGDGR